MTCQISVPSYTSRLMDDEVNNQTTNILESKFYENTLRINLEEFLLGHIDNFIEKGFIFSHIVEMNNSTNDDKMCKT